MFRMDKTTKEILQKQLPNKRERARLGRQSVYEAIAEDPFISSNVDLAARAGYDMKKYGSKSYVAGTNFVNRMLRNGYIEKQLGRDGKEYFYNSGKEYDLSTIIETEKDKVESLQEARETFAKELTDYEPLPEESEEVSLFSGCLSIGQGDSEANVQIKFADKSKAEIIDIISNLNLEDIF